MRQFFRQYYAPNNASLAIVGDFDAAEAKTLVEKYFGSLKSGPAVPRITVGDSRHHLPVRSYLGRCRWALYVTVRLPPPSDGTAATILRFITVSPSTRVRVSSAAALSSATSHRSSMSTRPIGSRWTASALASLVSRAGSCAGEAPAPGGGAAEEVRTPLRAALLAVRQLGRADQCLCSTVVQDDATTPPGDSESMPVRRLRASPC